jgi:hypothetical protein
MAARHGVPMLDPVSATALYPADVDVPARLRILADGYGLSAGERAELPGVIEQATEVCRAFVARRVAAGDPVHVRALADRWRMGTLGPHASPAGRAPREVHRRAAGMTAVARQPDSTAQLSETTGDRHTAPHARPGTGTPRRRGSGPGPPETRMTIRLPLWTSPHARPVRPDSMAG